MDVKTAFLNGKLEEDVYMTQPEGFVTPENAGKMLPLHKQRNPDLIIDPNILLIASISYDEYGNMKGVSRNFCSLVYSGGLSRDLDVNSGKEFPGIVSSRNHVVDFSG
ncbi:hypothetical protein V6N13_051314 [Hibiscus sabdariffa]